MKISKKNLLNAILAADAVAKSKTTLPILKSVRIEASKGTFTATGNSLDQYLIAHTECEGDMPACCVSARQLAGIADLFGDDVEMSLDKQLKISSDYTLNVLDASQFPKTPDAKATKLGIPCADLKAAIQAVNFACHKNSTFKTELYGVHVLGEAKSITATACNGRELAQNRKLVIAVPMDFTVWADFVDKFCEALGQDGAVLSVSENMAIVQYGGGEYGCKMNEAKFPNIKTITEQSRTEIGVINSDKWMPYFEAAVCMGGEDAKLNCRVLVSGERLEYVGNNGSISPMTPEKLGDGKQNLALNGATFTNCLNAFKGVPAKMYLMENTAICVEAGDMKVITTQLRQ